ncbi:unnamed protein product [Paramecium octaurelia]|uniref:Uncharacterized protein n=1 Tax=Paramecium octaurelia TaxID=43137 RepID=A0A8S1SZA0_PAROT|nr:unnamed protein product [Paramecium octaurelia]
MNSTIQIEQKLEELNHKYSTLIRDLDNYNIKKLSQIIQLHLTKYLEESDNRNYLYTDQNNNKLFRLQSSKVDVQEKYSSRIQLSPLLQILKELKNKANVNNQTELLLKCCLINQKQTQISAFNLLLQVDETDQNDFIEVLRYSLLHNIIEIIKLGTQLAKQVIKILNAIHSSILNFQSIQIKIYNLQSWRNLIRAIKVQSNQELSQNMVQIIQLCQTEKMKVTR